MPDFDKAAYEAEAQQLRLELKAWETAWAREHGGAKPGRDDIKGNAIAKQYTAYNRVRSILAGKTAPSARESHSQGQSHSATKRKSNVGPAPALTTPSKRRAVNHETPSRRAAVPSTTTATTTTIETPAISRKLFSPVVPTSIGPTPQRDGRVLGLFDVLSEGEGEHESAQTQKKRRQLSIDATPSRRSTPAAPLGTTPRKQTIDLANYPSDSDDSDENNIGRRLGRTPMSAGRRNLLNHFTAPPKPPAFNLKESPNKSPRALGTTPLKSRTANAQNAQSAATVTTPSKKTRSSPVEFATPAFLRRQAMPPPSAYGGGVDENNNSENVYFNSPPTKLRLPRKPLVRGLSSVLASLRKAEDDRLDEELAIMRELEGEAGGGGGAGTASGGATASPGGAPADTSDTVKDSQVDLEQQQLEQMEALLDDSKEEEGGSTRLLGGFDDEGKYDSEPEEAALDRGQPLRVYKKKGQKRTTRLVHMRPTRTKRPTAPVVDDNNDDDDDEDVVPETQARTSVDDGDADGDANDDDGLYGPDLSDDEGDDAKTKKAKAKTKANKPGKADKPDKADKEGTVKKATRKVNELAHANFKRLKLKNTGTKGGPRFNSRFRRRR